MIFDFCLLSFYCGWLVPQIRLYIRLVSVLQ
jgi:hypothetical protein